MINMTIFSRIIRRNGPDKLPYSSLGIVYGSKMCIDRISGDRPKLQKTMFHLYNCIVGDEVNNMDTFVVYATKLKSLVSLKTFILQLW
jgi:hypothetical protein